MKEKTIEGVDVTEMIQRKKEVEEQIRDIGLNIDQARVQPLGVSADEAKSRLTSFIFLHGGSEDRIPDNMKNKFEMLKKDLEEKDNAYKAARAKFKELSSELTALKDELKDLQSPKNVEDVSIEGLKSFVLEAIRPEMEKVKATQEKVDGLESKLKKLRDELDGPEFYCKSMDEATLLDMSVENHMSYMKKMEQQKERQRAVQDLIAKTESMLKVKVSQLEAEKKEFGDDLTYAVNVYTQGGVMKMTQDLKRMLREDEEYSEAATTLCQELLSETKTNPINTFGSPGRTPPVQTHLFCPDYLRNQARNVIEERIE